MKFNFNIPAVHLEDYNVFFLIANGIAFICTVLVVLSIILDFIQFHQPQKNKRKVNSWVETGSMFVFFFVYLLFLKSGTGKIYIHSASIMTILQSVGVGLIILGCYINIKGRMVLKHNWANQVTIYHNHTLVTQSVYAYIRHPLYASLIGMFIGGSLIYASYFAFLSVLFIFIPMMIYRAKQEERLLVDEFSEYPSYKKRAGMFFPKLFKQ